MFILHNTLYTDQIATAMQEHYGEIGKFTADKGRVEFTPRPNMRPLDAVFINEIKNVAFGYRMGLDDLAALTARVKELEAHLGRILRLEEYSFVLPNRATGADNVESTIKAFDEARAALRGEA